MKRFLYNCLVVFSIFIFPWWVASFLLLAGIFLFATYAEILFCALALDILYTTLGTGFFASHIFVIIGLIIFVVSIPLKERLNFYN